MLIKWFLVGDRRITIVINKIFQKYIMFISNDAKTELYSFRVLT